MFGGDRILDDSGVGAGFAEQGGSSSSMVAAKLVDAMARLPGFIGGNADARKAYTQALLKDHEGNTETWIEIEESQWPASWYSTEHGTARPVAVPNSH